MAVTPNYGLTKPVVGADTDAWGTMLNGDLDIIDAEIFKKASAIAPTFTGPVTINGALTVTGPTNLAATTVNSNFSVTGAASVAGNLDVGGELTVVGITDVTSIRFPNGDVVTGVSNFQTPWRSAINADGNALDRAGHIGIGAPANVNFGLLVSQPSTSSVYIQSSDAAPTGMAALYMAVSAGAITYWQMTTGGDTTGDWKLQHSGSGALIRIAPQGRFRIGAVADDGTSMLAVGGRARVATSASGVAPLAQSVLFVESNTAECYVETAAGVGKGCGYIFSANGTSLTSYIIDLNNQLNFVSATRPFVFNSNGSERMRISTSGNVGIGTDTPGFKLHVSGGRSMFAGNNEVYGVGLGYGAATPVIWLGATVDGDCQLSEAGGTRLARFTAAGHFIQRAPGTGVLDMAKIDNNSFTFAVIDNTTLRIYCRFTDGVVRSASLTFA